VTVVHTTKDENAYLRKRNFVGEQRISGIVVVVVVSGPREWIEREIDGGVMFGGDASWRFTFGVDVNVSMVFVIAFTSVIWVKK